MAKEFNITPKPKLLRAEQNARWNLHGAIAELIDNSFGPLRGNASAVWINFDTKSRELSVLDNGNGMDAIGSLFQLGNTIGRSVGDIGVYGCGGTKAILWIPDTVSVWTLRNDRVMYQKNVIWEDWFDRESFDQLNVSNEWVKATLSNTPAELLMAKHGTLIKMILREGRQIHITHLQQALSRLFAPGIRKGKRIEWRTLLGGKTRSELRLSDPFAPLPDATKTVRFDFVLEKKKKGEVVHLPVSGCVTYDKRTMLEESYIYIGLGYRQLMKTKDCFQSPDREQQYIGTGVSGYLDLGDGWQDFLNTTKEGISDDNLHDTLMGFIYQQIKHLLEMSENEVIDLQLEALTVGLQAALNAASDGPLIKVRSGRFFPNGPPSGVISEERSGPGPGKEKGPNKDGEREDEVPPAIQLLIWRLPGEQLPHVLARAEIKSHGNQIEVAINKDHPFMEEALKQKPMNAMALYHVIVSEIAGCILDLDSEQVAKLLKPDFKRLMDNVEEGQPRARMLTRFLLDHIGGPDAIHPIDKAA